MTKFLIPSEQFVGQNFNINAECSAENEMLQVVEPSEQLIEQPKSPAMQLAEVVESNTITLHYEETISTSYAEEIPQFNQNELEVIANDQEAVDFNKPRTIEQLGLSKRPATTLTSTIIDSMLEQTYKSTEAVVASRLAYMRQISDFISEYDSLLNVILYLAENFNVVLPCDRVNETTQEIMRMEIPVTREGSFNKNEMALIAIHLRKKIESFPQTAKELTTQIERLTSITQFKEAQILGLKNKLKTLEDIRPNTVNVFFIKRQDRDRYLYIETKPGKKAKDGKPAKSIKTIKTEKTLNANSIFYSQEEAESALVYAIKNRHNCTVRKVLTYQIIQLSYMGALPLSDKIQEVIHANK